MTRLRPAAAVALTCIGLFASGCGGSSSGDQESQWIGDVSDLVVDFAASDHQYSQAVLAAQDPQQIAQANAAYAAALGQLEAKVKATDPPAQCKPFEKSLLAVYEKLRGIASGLSTPGAVDTRDELLQGDQDFAAAKRAGTKALSGSVVAQAHC